MSETAGKLTIRAKTPAQISEAKKAILIFMGLMILFSAIAYIFIIGAGKSSLFYAVSIMWAPGLAALATCKILKRDLRTLGWKWPKARYIAASFMVPFIISLVATFLIYVLGIHVGINFEYFQGMPSSLGMEEAPKWLSIPVFIFLTYTTVILTSLFWALGEEIGWRGFLVPEMAKVMSFSKVAIVTAVIWAVWHYPTRIAYYNGEDPYYITLNFIAPLFTWIFACAIYAFIRLKSGSLWPAVVYHATGNGGMIWSMVIWRGDTGLYAEMFAVLVAFPIAWYCWNRAKKEFS